MEHALDTALNALAEPLRLLSSPESRLHVAFLATSVLLAVWVAWRTGATGSARTFWRALRHRSTRLDLKLIVANSLVRALLLAPLIVSTTAVLLLVTGLLRDAFGLPTPTELPQAAVIAIYSVALFVADDLTRFLVHLAMHRVPWLWRVHRVHHSAEVLTPLTLHRVHPLETLVMATRLAVTIGLVTGVCYHAFGGRLSQLEILGVNAFNIAFTAFGANLRHSHVWLSFGPRVERLFISPAQHQLHHSRDPRHHGTNYGAFLALWDRLAGTLRVTDKATREHPAPELTFGLDPAHSHGDSLRAAYLAPFRPQGTPHAQDVDALHAALGAPAGAHQRLDGRAPSSVA